MHSNEVWANCDGWSSNRGRGEKTLEVNINFEYNLFKLKIILPLTCSEYYHIINMSTCIIIMSRSDVAMETLICILC